MIQPILKVRRYLAELRLRASARVEIAPDVRVSFERISMADGSSLRIGSGSIVEANVALERAGAILTIGRNSFVGGSTIACSERIEIGEDVLIAWGGTIVDHDSHSLVFAERAADVRDWYAGRKDWTHVPRAGVRIHDRAWIGVGVLLLKGVTIGEEAVVGAGSVVTRDVPPRTLVAGNPARFIREIPSRERA